MVILPVVAVGGWVGYLRVSGNINVVDPGKVYRSGQLWPSQLESLLKEKGIRTLINLRGENPGTGWYDDEVNITRALGVQYISLPFSASHEPNDGLLDALTTAMATAQQPLLIHCEGGADRSGLASALYSLERMVWAFAVVVSPHGGDGPHILAGRAAPTTWLIHL
jgi:protein tyrosine/serine phosphatase